MNRRLEKRQSSRTLVLMGAFVILILVLFLYHRILTAYFVCEDYEWWSRVRGLNFIDSFRLFLPAELGGINLPAHFRPLVGWTVWLDTTLLGMKPIVFHVTNLIFHLINLLLVCLLSFYLFKKSLLAAFLAGLLFATFPFHSEAVVWSVGGRYDLLMTTFYLIALVAMVRYIQTENKGWIFIAPFAFFLGLLCKESAISLPLAVFGLLAASYSQPWLKTVRDYQGFLLSLVLVSSFFIRSLVSRATNPYVTGRQVKVFYVSRVFQWYFVVFLGSLFLRFLTQKMIPKTFKEKKRILWFLLIFIGLGYLPTATIPTQERYLYLPSAGAALFLGGLLSTILVWLQSKHRILKRTLLVLVLFLVIFNGSLLFKRNENWRIAGLIAREIAMQLGKELKGVPREEVVYLINLPDSYHGAYIYRTHIREAVELLMGKETPRLVVTPRTIGISSGISIVGQKTLRAESGQGFVFYRPVLDEQGRVTFETADYKVTQLNKKTIQIDLLADDFDPQKSLIYTFTGERVERL